MLSAATTVAVMAVIFIFSSQNGNISSGVSNGFGAWVLGVLGIDIPPGQTASEVVIVFGLRIRNLAHMFLYACLGAGSYCLAQSLCGIKLPSGVRRAALSSLCAAAFCLFYACTDELHQYFVPGRSATLRDVMFDVIGSASAIAVIFAVHAAIICLGAGDRRSKND